MTINLLTTLHDAGDITSGVLAPARLGSGSGGSTKFLREDSTFQTVSASAAWGAITGTLSDQSDLNTALAAKEATANKGAASGYASLDSGTKVPVAQIPTGTASTTVCIGNDSRLSDARTPTAHKTSHQFGGADAISVDGLSGLLGDGQVALAHAATHQNAGVDEISVAGLSGLLADGQTPLAHATSHKSGGSDAVKLDELAAPTDVTTLNSTSVQHGLCPKLSGSATTYLDGTGAFSAPVAAAGDTARVLASGLNTILANTCRYVVSKYEIASGAQQAIAAAGALEIG